MRNKSVLSILKIISKLVKSTPSEMVEDGLLVGIEQRSIVNFRANYNVKLSGRKWLAPLYRPVLNTFQVKKGTFLAARLNKKSVDLEFVEGNDSVTYTVKMQDWKEKEGYFLLIPPARLHGGLADNLKKIYELRRNHEQ
jgi:hypothetical protein